MTACFTGKTAIGNTKPEQNGTEPGPGAFSASPQSLLNGPHALFLAIER